MDIDYDSLVVALHGSPNQPGYSLLHGADSPVKARSERQYQAARARGLSSSEAFRLVVAIAAREGVKAPTKGATKRTTGKATSVKKLRSEFEDIKKRKKSGNIKDVLLLGLLEDLLTKTRGLYERTKSTEAEKLTKQIAVAVEAVKRRIESKLRSAAPGSVRDPIKGKTAVGIATGRPLRRAGTTVVRRARGR